MATTSKAVLTEKLIALFADTSPGSAADKANKFAKIIDDYVSDVLSKASATGSSPGGAVTISPGGITPN
jgi:hypothetical protein